MSARNSTVASPCVGMCDLFQGICMGCFRENHEINGWHDMTDAQRAEVLSALEKRRKEVQASS